MAVSNYYINPALTGVAAGYRSGGLIADMVFPIVTAAKQNGKIYSIDPNLNFLIPRDNARAAGAEPNAMDYEDPTTSSYSCDDHSLQAIVPDELVRQADVEARPAIATAERLVYNIALQREVELVTTLGTLSNTSSPSTKWDAASGDFIADVKAQFNTIRNGVGIPPNAIAMDSDTARKIVESASFRDRLKYTVNPSEVSRLGHAGQIAAVLGFANENVLIADATKNTAKLGQPKSVSSVWGENVLLFYKEDPRTAGGPSQNLGIHIVWGSGDSGAGQGGFEVATIRNDKRKGEEMIVHHYYDQKILNAGAGYLFTNTLA